MPNSHSTSDPSSFATLRVKCDIPGPAVQPIIALTEAFGAKPSNINGAGIIVKFLPAHLAELFEACVRGIADIYPDPPTPQVYLF